jgi:hypothetical protein
MKWWFFGQIRRKFSYPFCKVAHVMLKQGEQILIYIESGAKIRTATNLTSCCW